jgi:hypothetical protein
LVVAHFHRSAVEAILSAQFGHEAIDARKHDLRAPIATSNRKRSTF